MVMAHPFVWNTWLSRATVAPPAVLMMVTEPGAGGGRSPMHWSTSPVGQTRFSVCRMAQVRELVVSTTEFSQLFVPAAASRLVMKQFV